MDHLSVPVLELSKIEVLGHLHVKFKEEEEKGRSKGKCQAVMWEGQAEGGHSFWSPACCAAVCGLLGSGGAVFCREYCQYVPV